MKICSVNCRHVKVLSTYHGQVKALSSVNYGPVKLKFSPGNYTQAKLVLGELHNNNNTGESLTRTSPSKKHARMQVKLSLVMNSVQCRLIPRPFWNSQSR